MSPYDPPGKRARLVLESDNPWDLAHLAFLAEQNPHIWVREKPAVILPEEKIKENK